MTRDELRAALLGKSVCRAFYQCGNPADEGQVKAYYPDQDAYLVRWNNGLSEVYPANLLVEKA